MNILQKIEKKDPLLIADDDHPERKDITKKEALEAFNLIAKSLKNRKKPKRNPEFAKALIDSLNEL